MAEPDSPAGEPSPAPPPVSPDAPWQWSSVRERATTAAPVRVLPSAVGAELVAALRPGGFVRPNDFALGVSDGENVFAIRRANQHEAFGLSGEGE